MTLFTRRHLVAAMGAVALMAALPFPAVAQDALPELKIMAPAGAGGGWDSAARSLQQVMTKVGAVGSVQVTNVTGAGGTVGLAQFVNDADGSADQTMVGGITMVGAIISNKAPVNLSQVTPLGFSDVEHPGPYAIPAERVADLLREHGLRFVQMALPTGDAARGEKGIACLPGHEVEFRDGVVAGLAYAEAIGSGFVHVMSGLKPADVSPDDVWRIYVANLRLACDAAAEVGIPVLVEPIGAATISGYLVDHPNIALRALEEVAAPNLSLLFDAFHATNAGVDPVAFVRDHHARISHVHIADHPGRHEPGRGTFDFGNFFRTLDAVGYAGSVGLEYIPAAETAAGLGWRERLA